MRVRDVINGETNNYNIHIAHYLQKLTPSGNEIWSLNRILREKYFFVKNHAENEAEGLVQDLLFFKKAL